MRQAPGVTRSRPSALTTPRSPLLVAGTLRARLTARSSRTPPHAGPARGCLATAPTDEAEACGGHRQGAARKRRLTWSATAQLRPSTTTMTLSSPPRLPLRWLSSSSHFAPLRAPPRRAFRWTASAVAEQLREALLATAPEAVPTAEAEAEATEATEAEAGRKRGCVSPTCYATFCRRNRASGGATRAALQGLLRATHCPRRCQLHCSSTSSGSVRTAPPARLSSGKTPSRSTSLSRWRSGPSRPMRRTVRWPGLARGARLLTG
mmetsp:Transcript_14952/g.48344  ORF Transcript_14952/g.48344 Transcript_14952/m.48344 type:complete len:264 (-) Transcript_14952:401-1192(-)